MCLGKTATQSRFQAAALARVIREYRPDIVHSRNWAAIEAVAAARCLRIPVVHSEHGIETDASVREPWRRICLRRLAYALADRIVSVSYELRDLHARRTGFPGDRIAVIHNGVDCGRFRPDPDARDRVRAELGLSSDDVCVGSVANLQPVKDHMTLLQALPGLSACGKPRRLLILGEGPERPKLEAFVNAHGEWKQRVTFLGSSNSVPELLNALDVYVLPSLFEGISIALLEAMATGLPVAVAATGGNPEVVIDGESGMLFPARDSHMLASQLTLLGGAKGFAVEVGRASSAPRVRRVFDRFHGWEIRPAVRRHEAFGNAAFSRVGGTEWLNQDVRK